MLEQVNQVEYGLTCSIWTNDLTTAHRTAAAVEAGFVWINEVSKHFLGAPFGGYKQSGIGREECIEELLALHAREEHPREPEAPHRPLGGVGVDRLFLKWQVRHPLCPDSGASGASVAQYWRKRRSWLSAASGLASVAY